MSGFDLPIALIGWGAIGSRVADLLAERRAPVRLMAVGLRHGSSPRSPLPPGVEQVSDPASLIALRPALVIEVAGRAAVAPWALPVLEAGIDVAVSSTSALVDPALLDRLTGAARAARAQLIVPPGALGGIDALAAAARLPLDRVRHEVVKPPRAWKGTSAESLLDLDALTEATTFFEGPAGQAATDFPQNANVAAISALAGIGLDRTTVALIADPGAAVNRHRITAEGAFGRMEAVFDNRPLATNPKSSEMTALSLVRLIENRASPLVI